MPKVERVIHPTEWIRSIRPYQLRIAYVSLFSKHSFLNLISKYNRSLGLISNKFIHYSYNSEAERVAVYVVSLEDRIKEINLEADENKWKRKLPKGFYSKEKWEVGTEHE